MNIKILVLTGLVVWAVYDIFLRDDVDQEAKTTQRKSKSKSKTKPKKKKLERSEDTHQEDTHQEDTQKDLKEDKENG